MDRFDNNILKEFYRFLRRRNALAAYKQNSILAAKRRNFSNSLTPSMIMHNMSTTRLVSWPFKWKETLQGYNFWMEINHNWIPAAIVLEKQCKSLQNNALSIII